MRFSLALILVLVGCNGTDVSSEGDSDTPLGGDPGSDRPDTCQQDFWVIEVTGSVQGEVGEPLADARAQLCVRVSQTDELLCIEPARADASGAFVINVPRSAQCMRQAVMRVLLPGTDRVTGYCLVEFPPDTARVQLADPYVLQETTRATALPPLGDESLERTVEFADGLQIDATPERYFASGDGYDALAAHRLATCPLSSCPCETVTLEGVYGFSPEGDITGAPFPVRIPNSTSLAVGTEVTLYLLGGLGCTLEDGTHVEEGEWVAVGTATVGGDGMISGGSLPCINWFGYGL